MLVCFLELGRSFILLGFLKVSFNKLLIVGFIFLNLIGTKFCDVVQNEKKNRAMVFSEVQQSSVGVQK